MILANMSWPHISVQKAKNPKIMEFKNLRNVPIFIFSTKAKKNKIKSQPKKNPEYLENPALLDTEKY